MVVFMTRVGGPAIRFERLGIEARPVLGEAPASRVHRPAGFDAHDIDEVPDEPVHAGGVALETDSGRNGSGRESFFGDS